MVPARAQPFFRELMDKPKAPFPPYPAYKPSGVPWLGDIPAHWEVTPLFALMKERDERNQGNREQNVLSLSHGRIVRRDVKSNYGLLPASFETYQIVYQGDLVLRLTDLQNDQKSLRVGLVEEKGIITSAYVALIPKIDSRYAYYLLHSYDIQKVFYNFGAGVRQTMKFEDLKRFPILNPPLPEQRAIARFLDRETGRIDALIARKQRLIELLREKRAALITRAVTRGLNPDAPLKDSGVPWLGKIPRHWEVRKNKAIFFEVVEHSESGSEELLTVSHITGVTPRSQKQDVTMFMAESLVGYKVCQPGDLVINTMWAWMGALGITPILGIVSPSYNVYRGRKSVEVELHYLDYLYRTPPYVAEMNRFSKGVWRSRLRLYPDEFFQMSTPLPPLPEQRAIADYLDRKTGRIDALIQKIEASIETWKEYRTALITAAVTGKIDVREKGSRQVAKHAKGER